MNKLNVNKLILDVPEPEARQQTLKEFQAEAKSLGLPCSRKKKANLKRSIAKKKSENASQLLDEPVLEIDKPVLTPQPPTSYWQRSKQYAADKVKSAKDYVESITKKSKSKLNSFVNWLEKYVPPKPKIIDQAFDQLMTNILKLYNQKEPFEVIERKAALNEFAKQYVIHGKDGYDAESFMEAVKLIITKLIESKRETKINMILRCVMAKEDIKLVKL